MANSSIEEIKIGIGKRIQEIREKLNVESAEFGKMLSPEATAPTISAWERGNVPSSRIEELAKLGKVSVEYLITGHEYQESNTKDKPGLTGKITIITGTGNTLVTERMSRDQLIQSIPSRLGYSALSFKDDHGIPFLVNEQTIMEIFAGDYRNEEEKNDPTLPEFNWKIKKDEIKNNDEWPDDAWPDSDDDDLW